MALYFSKGGPFVARRGGQKSKLLVLYQLLLKKGDEEERRELGDIFILPRT